MALLLQVWLLLAEVRLVLLLPLVLLAVVLLLLLMLLQLVLLTVVLLLLLMLLLLVRLLLLLVLQLVLLTEVLLLLVTGVLLLLLLVLAVDGRRPRLDVLPVKSLLMRLLERPGEGRRTHQARRFDDLRRDPAAVRRHQPVAQTHAR